jgi:hypothetical protein
MDAIDGSLESLQERPASTGPHDLIPQHLLFLLHTLREDCRKLCLLLATFKR